MSAKTSTINQSEIEQFAKDSSHWWDENGPFKPLHRLNPVRLEYIKRQICSHYDREFNDINALKGLKILDIGCGGGLVCEPMARMGASVTGIDADENAITIAKAHSDLGIDYICGDAQNLSETYDIVLALEVIEHVDDTELFMSVCADRLKPDGLLILSTLNRTPKSYALGIIAAEYILRWVPRGTHSWKKFLKPSEITRLATAKKLAPIDVTGLIFNPVINSFQLSKLDFDVNYLIALRR